MQLLDCDYTNLLNLLRFPLEIFDNGKTCVELSPLFLHIYVYKDKSMCIFDKTETSFRVQVRFLSIVLTKPINVFGFEDVNCFIFFPGNHETLDMNRMYGFRGEVTSKYTSQMADLFTEVYNWLPLAHCINNRVLVMHGGLFSKDDVTLDDIRAVDRNKQPPEDGELLLEERYLKKL